MTSPKAKDTAYEKIRAAIFNGDFPPGHQLAEVKLADFCGASRSPVRQAIAALVDEGIALRKPTGRCYVADIGDKQLEEVFDILIYLEGYSAKLAANAISPQTMERLSELAGHMEASFAKAPNDSETFIRQNAEFHDLIHGASGNQLLLTLIDQVTKFRNNLFIRDKRTIPEDVEEGLLEHRRIIRALESKNARMAELEMQRHGETVRMTFMRICDERKRAANNSD